MTRRTGVLAGVLCFVGAAFLYSYDMMVPDGPLRAIPRRQLLGQIPWFLFFLGLVWLWRALGRSVREAIIFGVALVIAGAVSLIVEPFLMLFGVHWLVVIGVLFPIWIGLTARVPRRQPTQTGSGGETKT